MRRMFLGEDKCGDRIRSSSPVVKILILETTYQQTVRTTDKCIAVTGRFENEVAEVALLLLQEFGYMVPQSVLADNQQAVVQGLFKI